VTVRCRESFSFDVDSLGPRDLRPSGQRAGSSSIRCCSLRRSSTGMASA